MRLTTLVMACVLAVTPAMAQDKATIEKINEAFIGAFKRGDFATVAALYTEDATVLPLGSTLIKGRPGIQAFRARAGQGISDVQRLRLRQRGSREAQGEERCDGRRGRRDRAGRQA